MGHGRPDRPDELLAPAAARDDRRLHRGRLPDSGHQRARSPCRRPASCSPTSSRPSRASCASCSSSCRPANRRAAAAADCYVTVAIRLFTRRGVGQEIQDELAAAGGTKSGTPTMDGIMIILASLAGYLLPQAASRTRGAMAHAISAGAFRYLPVRAWSARAARS